MLVGLPRERERPACGELEKRTVEGNCCTIFKFYLQLLFLGGFRRTISRNVKSDIAFCVETLVLGLGLGLGRDLKSEYLRAVSQHTTG